MRWNPTDLTCVLVTALVHTCPEKYCASVCLWCLFHSWLLSGSRREKVHSYPGMEAIDPRSNALWWRLPTFEHCPRENGPQLHFSLFFDSLFWFFSQVHCYWLLSWILILLLSTPVCLEMLPGVDYAKDDGQELSWGWTGMCSSLDKRWE